MDDMMHSVALNESCYHDDDYVLVNAPAGGDLLAALADTDVDDDDDEQSYDYCDDACSSSTHPASPSISFDSNALEPFDEEILAELSITSALKNLAVGDDDDDDGEVEDESVFSASPMPSAAWTEPLQEAPEEDKWRADAAAVAKIPATVKPATPRRDASFSTIKSLPPPPPPPATLEERLRLSEPDEEERIFDAADQATKNLEGKSRILRLTNKKRRKKMKLARQAAAAAAAAAALAQVTMNTPASAAANRRSSGPPQPTLAERRATKKLSARALGRKENRKQVTPSNMAVSCATKALVRYKVGVLQQRGGKRKVMC
jgi:hypothetical protein